MVLPDVEAAVTEMVQRWQLELIAVQQQFGFDEVDDTMRRLEGQVDAVGGGGAVEDDCGLGGWCRVADLLAVADAQRDLSAVDRIVRIMVRLRMGRLLARWCARMTRAKLKLKKRAIAQAGKTVVKERKRCERVKREQLWRLAHALWVGSRLSRVVIARWLERLKDNRSERVAVLRTVVDGAGVVILRSVWLHWVEVFWVAKHSKEPVVSDEVRVRMRGRNGEGAGDSVVYDWTCTLCGWGGSVIEAGHSTCSKCGWQCHSWCDAAAGVSAEDGQLVERLVRQYPVGRRVAAGAQRRMRKELERLLGSQEVQQRRKLV